MIVKSNFLVPFSFSACVTKLQVALTTDGFSNKDTRSFAGLCSRSPGQFNSLLCSLELTQNAHLLKPNNLRFLRLTNETLNQSSCCHWFVPSVMEEPQQSHGSRVTRVPTRRKSSTRRSSRRPSSTGSDHRDAQNESINNTCATSIHAALSTLLLSEKFSDMTITCGGREFKAHRAVVCTQSSFFDKAFTSDFRVSNWPRTFWVN